MENKSRREVIKMGVLGAGAMALGSSSLNAAEKAKIADLANKSIKYKYDGGDTYRVEFTKDTKGKTFAHWYILDGKAKGQNRNESADFAQIAPNIWFVSWLEPTQEVVSFVADFNNNKITCSYYGDKERYWLKGDILEIKDL